MAKTLRVRTRTGWTTKPVADTPANRLLAEEIDDNFLEIEDQHPELTGGASADFTAMPQVGGDPIVESGSNADGEWTRWSDGTQITSQQFSLGPNLGVTTNGFYEIDQRISDFPVAFSAVPRLSISAANVLSTSEYSLVTADNSNNPATAIRTGRIRGLVVGSLDTLGVDVIAYGRWK